MNGPLPQERVLDALTGDGGDVDGLPPDFFEAIEEGQGQVPAAPATVHAASPTLDLWEGLGEPLIKAALTLSDLPLEERLQRVWELAEWTGRLGRQMAEAIGARWETVDDPIRWRCAQLAAGVIGEVFQENPETPLAQIGEVLIPALSACEGAGSGLISHHADGQLDLWAALSPVVAAVQRSPLGWEPAQLVRHVAERLDALVKPAAAAVGAQEPKARVALLAAAAKFYSHSHYVEADRQFELGIYGGVVPSDLAVVWKPVEECLALLVETGLALGMAGEDAPP